MDKNIIILLILFIVVGVILRLFKKILISFRRSDLYRILYRQKYNLVSFFLLVFFILTYYIQKIFNTQFIDLKDYSLLEVLTFSFGVIGIYGIYYGFLQFIAGFDKNDMYLGRSKSNYLLNKGYFAILISTEPFSIILLGTVILPFLFSVDWKVITYDNFVLLWQTCMIILVLTFTLLLLRILKNVRNLLRIKENEDQLINWEIEEAMSNFYLDLYLSDYSKNTNYFLKNLKDHYRKINHWETFKFLGTVFKQTQYTSTIEKLDKMNKDLSLYYIQKFILQKWEFLFSVELCIEELTIFAKDELHFLKLLFKENEKEFLKIMLKEEDSFSLKRESPYYFIINGLFKRVKSEKDYKNIIYLIEKGVLWKNRDVDKNLSIARIEYFNTIHMFILEKLIKDTFQKNEVEYIDSKLSLLKEIYERNDMLKIDKDQFVFDRLIDNTGEIKKKLSKEEMLRLQKLLKLLPQEFIVSFILYQILYPGSGRWNINMELYENISQNLYLHENFSKFTKRTAEILGNTNIKYKLTNEKVYWIFSNLQKNIDIELMNILIRMDIPFLKFLKIRSFFAKNISSLSSNYPFIRNEKHYTNNQVWLKLKYCLEVISTNPIIMTDYNIYRDLMRFFNDSETYILTADIVKYWNYKEIYIYRNQKPVKNYLSSPLFVKKLLENKISNELFKYYILMLANDDYLPIYEDKNLLELFLKRVTRILNEKSVSVEELVDMLTANFKEYRVSMEIRISKHQSRIIKNKLLTYMYGDQPTQKAR